MHTVAVLALDHVVASDLATPIEVFRRAETADGHRPYRVLVCAEAPRVDGETFTIIARHGLEALGEADTIIVPGCSEEAPPPGPRVLGALRAAAASGTRIASICAGAFTLAEAGLLDGLTATTHWAAARRLAEAHPRVDVRPDVLYIDHGRILTSAGAAAGLDLCLHLVRRDLGAAAAAAAARMSVTPLEREGGQAQFIAHTPPPVPRGSMLEPVFSWIEDNLAHDVTLASMAASGGLSERTLSRRFRDQTGTTPLQWLLRARVRRAQFLLETTDEGIERIAAQVGFQSPTAFRERFKRIAGVTPRSYRSSFRSPAS
ncbi:GlxA family transcriptional regulator [Actinomadura roseirufa]|uniref:GlxA family transcriptional regulator n=1 Tax=Actinomadura roseirufa TaxID=2094049 RepID=UPI001040F608|nr:helix-turn-helix domain-containing protein [Actinomadura roseirufa]